MNERIHFPGLDRLIHVTPIDDLREHQLSTACWCCPTQDDEEPSVWVHHAMDRREEFEQGQRQPS